MNVAAPRYRLPEACAMSGAPVHHVREVLNDRRMLLLAQPFRRKGVGVRVSVIDLLRLAALAKLRAHGLNDAAALYVLDVGIDPLLGGLAGAGVDVPMAVLRARVGGAVIHVSPSDFAHMPPDVYATPLGVPAPAGAPVSLTLQLGPLLADLSAHISSKESA